MTFASRSKSAARSTGCASSQRSDRRRGPGEVLIDVAATGLNFRDVLNALNRYPGDASSLGSECAGTVAAVGEGVTRVAVGDRVLAMAEGSFASFATAPQAMVARLPEHLSYGAAATIPITFLTAAWSLQEVGGLRAGETVLIHAGAGGVGMAAIQLAQHVGARIFATAGSPAKRQRLVELGVEAVFDSRSLDFSQQILERTEGRGVDVVLNSLADEFVDASVACLADDGRFLEIGKTGVWTTEQFTQVRPNGKYDVIFLGEECVRRPDDVGRWLDEIVGALDRGELQPLPARRFPLEHAVDAFRFMAQARHVGKVVLMATTGVDLAPGASYLVTGGLGGIGLAVAEDWAARGARRLVLAGRRAPDAEVSERLDRLRASGVEVDVRRLDVTDAAAVSACIDDLAKAKRPLRGVLHAAGVLADGMARQLDRDGVDGADGAEDRRCGRAARGDADARARSHDLVLGGCCALRRGRAGELRSRQRLPRRAGAAAPRAGPARH